MLWSFNDVGSREVSGIVSGVFVRVLLLVRGRDALNFQ